MFSQRRHTYQRKFSEGRCVDHAENPALCSASDIYLTRGIFLDVLLDNAQKRVVARAVIGSGGRTESLTEI